MRALLDTSYFIASETGRPLRDIDDITQTEISVITLAELTLGVLMADDTQRAQRVETLSTVESTWTALPITAEIARQFAQIVASLRQSQRRVPLLDSLVAATALIEGIPVVTQDRDYDTIPGVTTIHV